MKELIERIECAEGASAALFWDAYRATFPSLRSRDHSVEECEQSDLRAYRFGRMLDAEAWLSAAEMLVPEGSTFSVDEGPAEIILTGHTEARGRAEVYTMNPDHSGPLSPLIWQIGWGATPALALAAAALKARGE